MGLEVSFNYIDDFNSAWPNNTPDTVDEGDDHIRGIKNVFLNQFPNLGSTIITATGAELNTLDGITKPAAELNNAPQFQMQTTATAVISGSTVNLDLAVPSWAKRITVSAHKLSLLSTGSIAVQIGAGSFNTAGYEGMAANNGTGSIASPTTEGIYLFYNASSAQENSGELVLRRLDTTNNIWMGVGQGQAMTTNTTFTSVGRIATGGTLDRIRIIAFTDTFDSANGQVGLIYEG